MFNTLNFIHTKNSVNIGHYCPQSNYHQQKLMCWCSCANTEIISVCFHILSSIHPSIHPSTWSVDQADCFIKTLRALCHWCTQMKCRLKSYWKKKRKKKKIGPTANQLMRKWPGLSETAVHVHHNVWWDLPGNPAKGPCTSLWRHFSVLMTPMQASSGWGISVCGRLNSSVTYDPVVPRQVVCCAVFLPYFNLEIIWISNVFCILWFIIIFSVVWWPWSEWVLLTITKWVSCFLSIIQIVNSVNVKWAYDTHFPHTCNWPLLRGIHLWLVVYFSHKGTVMRSFGDFFVVRLNMLLNKQLSFQWFETSWCSCDITLV